MCIRLRLMAGCSRRGIPCCKAASGLGRRFPRWLKRGHVHRQVDGPEAALAQRALNSLEDRLLAVAAAWAPGETAIQAYAAWLEDCIEYLSTVFRLPPYANLGAHLSPPLRQPHRGRTTVDVHAYMGAYQHRPRGHTSRDA